MAASPPTPNPQDTNPPPGGFIPNPQANPQDVSVQQWQEMGLADTQQAEQFYSEEWNAAYARGGAKVQNPFSGWSLQPGEAGDFWTLYSELENYAANTGWRNLADPNTINALLKAGASSWDSYDLYSYLGQKFGNAQSQPWGLVGMSHTDFNKYKIQNENALQQQFGGKYSDAQVVQSMRNPLQSFNAQGSAFGQEAPFVSAQPAQNLGHQSSVR